MSSDEATETGLIHISKLSEGEDEEETVKVKSKSKKRRASP